MGRTSYRVVFNGEYLYGREPAQVRRQLAGLFKTDPERIERLLGAIPAVIRKNLGRPDAEKYLRVLEKAGLACSLEPEPGQEDLIRFRCDACQRKLAVPSESAGTDGRCPNCGAPVVVPAAGVTEEMPETKAAPEKEPPAVVPPGPEPAAGIYFSGPLEMENKEPEPVAPSSTAGPGKVKPLGPVELAFRPLTSVKWPEKCVACFNPRVSERVKLSVMGATSAAAGAGIGAKSGGIVAKLADESAAGGKLAGMVIGGVVGSLVSGVKGEAMEYQIPFCRSCRAKLSKTNLNEMVDISSKPVETPFLTRRIQDGCVVVRFNNPEYAELFQAANKRYAFATIEELRNADDSVEVLPMGDPDLETDERIKKHLAQYLPAPGLFVHPDIPKDKLLNTRKNIRLSMSVPVIGVLDLTLFGSLDNAVLFGKDRIYYHNPGRKVKEKGEIHYEAFPERSFGFTDENILALGPNDALDLTNCTVNKAKVFDMFESIRLGLLPEDHPDRAGLSAGPSRAEPRPPAPGAVLEMLNNRAQNGLFIHPRIPDKKLKNIRESLKLSPKEKILGLVDSTIMGSGKHGLIFTETEILYHNDWTVKSRQGRFPYTDILKRRIMADGKQVLKLDNDESLSLIGEMAAQDLADLLLDVGRLCLK